MKGFITSPPPPAKIELSKHILLLTKKDDRRGGPVDRALTSHARD